MPHLPAHFRKKTVAIVSEGAPGGHVRINEEDFDPDQHEVWEPPAEPEVEAEAEAEAEAEVTLESMKNDELRQLAKERHGVLLAKNLNKQELIAAIRDLGD